MTSPTLVHANHVMVAKAWLATCPDLPPNKVATTLPEVEKWADTGFITVGPIFPGTPGRYAAERGPVIQINTYAVFSTQTKRPNYGRANDLAEIILNYSYLWEVPTVTLPPGVKPVHLRSIYPVTEVYEVPEPDNGVAHYAVDMALGWMETGPMVGIEG